MNPWHPTLTSDSGGPQQGGPANGCPAGQVLGIRRANRVDRFAVDENCLFQQRDDLSHADAFGKINDRSVQRTGGGGIDDGGLAAGQDAKHLAHRFGIGDGPGHPRCHDFALQCPIVKVLQISA